MGASQVHQFFTGKMVITLRSSNMTSDSPPIYSNSVLLVKIEGPVWYTIYHHLPVVKGVSSNPSINQPTNGKRTSIYRWIFPSTCPFTGDFQVCHWLLSRVTIKESSFSAISGWWLSPTPLKNMSSSVGIVIANIWKVIKHVPNHQPDILLFQLLTIINSY